MFLMCFTFSGCCTSKLNLKLICHANGVEVFTLGFVLCRDGDARDKTALKWALPTVTFWNMQVCRACSSTAPEETFLALFSLPWDLLIKAGEIIQRQPVSPGDTRLTPNRGYTASPILFHFSTRDGSRVGKGIGAGMEAVRDNETGRGNRGREGGIRIDPACKATAAGWRSVVWSHSYGSLQETLLVISQTCNTFRWNTGSWFKT